MSHKRRYNLRHSDERRTDTYDDSQTEEEDDDLEEDDSSISSPQQGDISHRSYSDRSQGSSILSSTASNSFSYHDGNSPSVRSVGKKPNSNTNRLYPSLSPESGSPTTKRRNVQNEQSSCSSSKKTSPHKLHKISQSSLKSGTSPLNQQESDSIFGLPKWLVCGGVILLLICCLVVNKFSGSSSDDLVKHQVQRNLFQEFSGKVNKLEGKFPEQTPRFWKVIKASAFHVLNAQGEAAYPAVLLMVGDKENDALSADIAHAVGQAFENTLRSSQDVASLNLISHPGKDKADSQKLAVDKWLTHKLANYSTVILSHIEVLEPEAALIFHGYCDGDNAPFKNNMLILQLSLEEQVDSQQAAEKALQTLWLSKLEEDKVGALLSRVANNIAVVSANSNRHL